MIKTVIAEIFCLYATYVLWEMALEMVNVHERLNLKEAAPWEESPLDRTLNLSWTVAL